MEHVYFFTGFPGFLTSQLVREVIRADQAVKKIYLLVLPSQLEKAALEVENIINEFEAMPIIIELLEGDITKPGLSISHHDQHKLTEEITHAFHLAAIYDLAVREQLAEVVNVVGTKNVNDWIKTLIRLKRYIYFSTAYVAGNREGDLYESELIRPASFKNHYERTKYDAEVLVQSLKEDIPITIIRPGIVKGHSQTGETIKFDGPYFILNFLDRLRFLPIFPYIAPRASVFVNLVPVDFIIKATAYLALYKEGEGKTYHLTDPDPCTATEIYELFVQELYKKEPKGQIPFFLSKLLLNIKSARTYLGVEKEALDYFTWQGRFDCTEATKDLQTSGIVCPSFRETVPAMVDFYQQNKDNPAYQILIR